MISAESRRTKDSGIESDKFFKTVDSYRFW